MKLVTRGLEEEAIRIRRKIRGRHPPHPYAENLTIEGVLEVLAELGLVEFADAGDAAPDRRG